MKIVFKNHPTYSKKIGIDNHLVQFKNGVAEVPDEVGTLAVEKHGHSFAVVQETQSTEKKDDPSPTNHKTEPSANPESSSVNEGVDTFLAESPDVVVPTKEEVVAAGYDPAVADKIIETQKSLADKQAKAREASPKKKEKSEIKRTPRT